MNLAVVGQAMRARAAELERAACAAGTPRDLERAVLEVRRREAKEAIERYMAAQADARRAS
jgi:hypothetical protein